MKDIHVSPTTGLMISRLQTGHYLVAQPARPIRQYEPEEVEHFVLHTPVESVRVRYGRR